MFKSPRNRMSQFSLRALFCAVTGCAVALTLVRVPLPTDVKDPSEFRLRCVSGMSQQDIRDYQRRVDAMREPGYAYHDYRWNPIKHGLAVLYDENGVKIRERHWAHGQLEGLETKWDSQGRVERQTTYHDGKRHGWAIENSGTLRMFWDNDVLVREESYCPYATYVTKYDSDGYQVRTEWSREGTKFEAIRFDAQHRRCGMSRTFHQNGEICSEQNVAR